MNDYKTASPDIYGLLKAYAYHSERLQMEDDELREEHLNRMGYRVIRFTNEEVLYDTQNTLDEIMSKIEKYE